MAPSSGMAAPAPARTPGADWAGTAGRLLVPAVCVPVLLFLLVPILIIVPMALTRSDLLTFPPDGVSVRPFLDFLGDAQWVASAVTSLKVAVLATAVACAVGSASAMALHRNPIWLKGAITTLILMPLMIPVVVLALGDYLFLARLELIGGWVAIGLAHSVLVTPYVFIAVQASLAGLDPALPRAARSLGGGQAALLRDVYWPAIRPGVAGGAVFAFIGSFDEVVVSLFLSGPSVTTLPVQMFTSLQYDLSPKIAAVSSLLFFLSLVALATQVLQRAGSAKPGREDAELVAASALPSE